MMALDASKRDICVVKRERTSSPVQALVLLNDPQLVEASRVLAHRLVAGHAAEIYRYPVSIFHKEDELLFISCCQAISFSTVDTTVAQRHAQFQPSVSPEIPKGSECLF